jgi:hypothetical protein
MRWENRGPLRVVNCPVAWCQICVPSRSAGKRSGVNWMRLNSVSTALANTDTAVVLARPGTPSSRMCPSANKPMSSFSSMSRWPTRTRRTSCSRVSRKALAPSTRRVSSMASTCMLGLQTIHVTRERTARPSWTVPVPGAEARRLIRRGNPAGSRVALQDDRPLCGSGFGGIPRPIAGRGKELQGADVLAQVLQLPLRRSP